MPLLMEQASRSNASVDWEQFDPDAYFERNYKSLRDDDREIMKLMSEHFARAPEYGRSLRSGIDVGTGTNLYPALAMLPWCYHVTLCDHAKTNCAWLEKQLPAYSPAWDPYWAILAEQPSYKDIAAPRAALESRSEVQPGSIFDLPEASYEMGTMFFVAESITSYKREFRKATLAFVRSLTSHAPFAAAFMRKSNGYAIGEYNFPAVAITEVDVQECLSDVASGVKITTIESRQPLRRGVGMMLATGWADRR